MRMSASGAVIIATALIATAGIIATHALSKGTAIFADDTLSSDKQTLPAWLGSDIDAMRHRVFPTRH